MQVAQIQEHITHAVLTNNKAMDVGIDDDPAFYHMLSSTLYSDQILAIVREVLCNAWDAHVESGRTDQPIQIHVKDDEFTVRDFGHGIPADKVQSVYGVYGRSTKKANGALTGGFGLGCKSPWAYQDVFEVTIRNQGVMTVYSMSKSNAEKEGRPGILPIVSAPTTETGLKVSIKIKNRTDSQRFAQLAERIIRNGGMNAMLNDRKIESLPFDKMKHGFMIVRDQLGENNNECLFVRYGHVIYPIPEESSVRVNFNQCRDILKMINNGHWGYANNGWKLILQAEPHSITITPSRETLSMQDQTVKTINELMLKFIGNRPSQMQPHAFKVMENSLNNFMLQMDGPSKVMNFDRRIINIAGEIDNTVKITTYAEFTDQWMKREYPGYNGFFEKDLKLRFDNMEQMLDRGLVQSYRRAFRIREARQKILKKKLRHETFMTNSQRQELLKEENNSSSWFHRKMLWPLMKKMQDDDRVSYKKLCLYTKHSMLSSARNSYSNVGYIDAERFPKIDLEASIGFLRKIVVLAFNRQSIERIKDFAIIKHWFKSERDVFVYITPRSPEKFEAARAFWAESGYHVIDLTKVAKWEPATVIAPIKPVVIGKPRKKGIPLLSNGIVAGQGWMQSSGIFNPEAERSEKPKAILLFNAKNNKDAFGNYDQTDSRYIAETWGKDIGVVVNENQATRYLGFGCVSFQDFILEKIVEEFRTDHFKLACAFDYARHEWMKYYRGSDRNLQDAIKVIWADKDFRELMGVEAAYTDKQKRYISIYNNMQHAYRSAKLHNEIQTILKTKPSPKVDEIIENMKKNKLANIFDNDKMLESILYPNICGYSVEQREKIRNLFLSVLEG